MGLEPAFAFALAGLGDTYRYLERHADALTWYDQALQLESDARWITGRGLANQELGNHAEALADYDRAIGMDPGNF